MTATQPDDAPVLAADTWRSNAELIADVAKLGYLKADYRTLDPTYGLGVFWRRWRPDDLVACDLDPAKSPLGRSVDFTNLPWPAGSFSAVVLDPPYKLNGTPTADIDARYGVDEREHWRDRLDLIERGIAECARVLRPGGTFLLKCADQVCSGQIRWQTDEFSHHAAAVGFRKVDRFDMLGHARPQPRGRRQVHARGRGSTLLVFERLASSLTRNGAPADEGAATSPTHPLRNKERSSDEVT